MTFAREFQREKVHIMCESGYQRASTCAKMYHNMQFGNNNLKLI